MIIALCITEEFLVSSAKIPYKNYFSIWQQVVKNSYCKLEKIPEEKVGGGNGGVGNMFSKKSHENAVLKDHFYSKYKSLIH